MIGLQDASGTAGIARVAVQDAGGKSDIARISVLMPGGGDYLVFDADSGAGSLSLSINPVSAIGASGVGGPTNVSTNSVTVTASGGTGPYSYAWTLFEAALGTWSISTPSERTTRFVAQNLSESSSGSATFRCTVTDARGRTGSVNIEASAFNYGRFLF